MGRLPSYALRFAALFLLYALAACSTVGGGSQEGTSSEVEARQMRPDDPLARPTQVGWVSARASRCGFVFDPGQLRSQYLASEAAYGYSQLQMQKIRTAYDYTRESVLDKINKDPTYCNKDRLKAIRVDLNRYLSGDYSPSARLAR